MNASATTTTDTKCADLTECTLLEYMSDEPTAITDRKCSQLTVCDRASEYQTAEPSYFVGKNNIISTTLLGTNRECTACTPCAANEISLTGCDGLVDSVCTAKEQCVANYCKNGGECTTIATLDAFNVTDGTALSCACADDFTGTTCEIRKSVCKTGTEAAGSGDKGKDGDDVSEPTCLNNGECTSTGMNDDDFVCQCTARYGGVTCNLDYEICNAKPCEHEDLGSVCSVLGDQPSDFECDCAEGWAGPTCKFDQAICVNSTRCTSSGYEFGQCAVTKLDTGGNPEQTCICDPSLFTPPILDEPQSACGELCDMVYDYEAGTCTDERIGASSAEADAKKELTTIAGILGGIIAIALLVTVLSLQFARKQIKVNAQYEAFKKGEAIVADDWEITPRHLLTVGQQIGSGNFGLVNKGMYMDPKMEVDKTATLVANAVDVAIKSLKLSDKDYGVIGEDNKVNLDNPAHRAAAKEFFDEMDLMKEIGIHRNVVNLIGVCTQDRPYLIVIEFCGEGDLRGFLQKRRPKAGKQQQVDQDDMFDYAIQVANGMEHLSVKHRIVHRDLAARNVLVKNVKGVFVCKISDFGLARDVYEEDFYQKSENGVMAIKWMAPEALTDRIFTTKGDVWSYGIVMWEISTLGYMPYPGYQNHQIEGILSEGYRMPYPQSVCGEDYFSVALKCWEYEEEPRPSFTQIKSTLIVKSGFNERKLKQILGDDFDLAAEKEAEPAIYADMSEGPDGDLYLTPTSPTYTDVAPTQTQRPLSVQGTYATAAAGSSDAVYDMGGAGGPPSTPMADSGPMYDMGGGGQDEASWMAAPDAINARGISRRTAEDIATFTPLTLERDGGIPRFSDGQAGQMYDQATTQGGGYTDVAPNSMTDAEVGMYDDASAEAAGMMVQDNNMYDIANGPKSPTSPVYVAQTLSDENAGGLYDTADDDANNQVQPVSREESTHSGFSGGITEHSFGEIVVDSNESEPRPSSVLASVVVSEKEVGVDARHLTQWGSQRPSAPGSEVDMEAQWEPVERDASSSSFRMKSVHRANPLLEVANL
jgi:serine/threonine protein kinase